MTEPSSVAPGPLDGVSVVVTRPRSSGDELADALAAAGARVRWVPTIEIHDPLDGGATLRGALAVPGNYAWIVFTSMHAVDRVMHAAGDGGALAGVRLAAVGRATAAALERYGLAAALVPGSARAAALAEELPVPGTSPAPPKIPAPFEIPARAAASRRVLFPRAQDARPTLPAGLRAKGWEVDEVVAYRTLPAPAPPESMLGALSEATAIVFSSPSAVHAYLDMRVAETGTALPLPPVVVCGGPTTAAAARAAGLAVAAESRGPSPEALLCTLVASVGSRARGPRAGTP